MNWENNRFKPIRCRFTPRDTYDGRNLKPELKAHRGQILDLVARWKMDADDPYPGEWALGIRDYRPVFGDTLWIASGDVTVLPKNDQEKHGNA